MGNVKDGVLIFAAGRTRMGKTSLIRERIKSSKRLLIYDPKGAAGDYVQVHTVSSMPTLIRTLKKVKGEAGRYRFIDHKLKSFDLFCRTALVWGREFGGCTVVCDELAAVTSPSKAPPGWGQLVRMGLGYGISIYAISQRPAECDKTCISNATELTTFHMKRLNDRKYMAGEMDIDVEKINELKSYHYLSDQHRGKVLTTKK
jgi:hypothetical protein